MAEAAPLDEPIQVLSPRPIHSADAEAPWPITISTSSPRRSKAPVCCARKKPA
jgi:hypothetical protein